MLHCHKTNLNLGIKTEPVAVGAKQIQQGLLQPWQARFLCRDSDYILTQCKDIQLKVIIKFKYTYLFTSTCFNSLSSS